MKEFATQVYEAVRTGNLAQPFSAETVQRACPGWAAGTYRNFFNKHRVGNPGGQTELFVRGAPNRFKIKNSNCYQPQLEFDNSSGKSPPARPPATAKKPRKKGLQTADQ